MRDKPRKSGRKTVRRLDPIATAASRKISPSKVCRDLLDLDLDTLRSIKKTEEHYSSERMATPVLRQVLNQAVVYVLDSAEKPESFSAVKGLAIIEEMLHHYHRRVIEREIRLEYINERIRREKKRSKKGR